MGKNLSPIMVIGNSGIILSKLQSAKTCSLYDLLAHSGLSEVDFYIACGYLLKENRIVFYDNENRTCIKLISE